MKSILTSLLIPFILLLPVSAQNEAKPADPFEDGMRQAFNAYKKGENEAVTAKLRELLKIMEDKNAAKLGGLLPDALGDWKAETLKQENLGLVGGGVSLSRIYVSGEKRITVAVVKDSPLVAQLLPLFVNEELLRMTNRTMHKISGETGVMEGTDKLQVVVDERIYLELVGTGGAGETELVALAGKLDLKAMAKIK
jgi:hypothetical protein